MSDAGRDDGGERAREEVESDNAVETSGVVRTAGSALAGGPEFDLIREILENDARTSLEASGAEPRGRARILQGPGDDCAVIDAGRLAISTDVAVEGVHFERAWLTPHGIGYRSAAAALSDLAAAAARPAGLLATIVVPPDRPRLAVDLMAGISDAAHQAGACVLGGDLSAGGERIVITVTVMGTVDRVLGRAGAQPGDDVWITGVVGGAAAAVKAWKAGRPPAPGARGAFERPVPRIREAIWLAQQGFLSATIDVSDGIASDAAHLAAASGVRITLDLRELPLHPDITDDVMLGLTGGDDYELLFCAPPALRHAAGRFAEEFPTRLTRIGHVASGAGVFGTDASGDERELTVRGYVHFGLRATDRGAGSESKE